MSEHPEYDEDGDPIHYITNRSDNPIINEIVELAAEARTIQDDILPDLRRQLAELTIPDYDASKNPDDEYRDQDIEELKREISDNEKRVRAIRRKQKRLSDLYQSGKTKG